MTSAHTVWFALICAQNCMVGIKARMTAKSVILESVPDRVASKAP